MKGPGFYLAKRGVDDIAYSYSAYSIRPSCWARTIVYSLKPISRCRRTVLGWWWLAATIIDDMAADTEVFPISLTMVLSGASHVHSVVCWGVKPPLTTMLTTFVSQWVAQPHNQTDCYPTTLPPTLLPHRCPGVLANHGRPFMHPTRLS